MGWARPFVRAVYELAADTHVTIVFVPCPYATGREPQTAHDLFPRATVVPPKQYARFLMGRAVEGMEKGPGALQYLGGDLYHAKTIAKRMGLTSMTYKFSRRNFAHSFVRFFALDEANAAELRATGAPPDRVRIVGNLVADSVLESVASPAPAPSRATHDLHLPRQPAAGVARAVAILSRCGDARAARAARAQRQRVHCPLQQRR